MCDAIKVVKIRISEYAGVPYPINANDLQNASEGQTEFTAAFTIANVYKNNQIQTSGITGLNTTTVTFANPLSLGDEVYLTT